MNTLDFGRLPHVSTPAYCHCYPTPRSVLPMV